MRTLTAHMGVDSSARNRSQKTSPVGMYLRAVLWLGDLLMGEVSGPEKNAIQLGEYIIGECIYSSSTRNDMLDAGQPFQQRLGLMYVYRDQYRTF